VIARTGPWAALLAVVAGCVTELNVQDHGVLTPTVRVSKKLSDPWMIDVIADYSAGKDTQSIAPGRYVEVGGKTFTGSVGAEFDLTTVRIEGRARNEISPEWLVDGFVGVGFSYLDVRVTSGRESGHETDIEVGPLGGGRIGWRPVPRVQVYTEGYAMFPIPDGIVPVGEVELGIEYKAAGPVSLLGGWRFRNLDLIHSGSDFDMEWSGAFFGLAFDF